MGRIARLVIVASIAWAIYYFPTALQPKSPDSRSMLFFDGVCNLCDGFVNFVADHDARRRVQFGALHRHRDLLVHHGAGRYAEGGEEALSTLVLVQDGDVYVRSAAALRVLAMVDGPWSGLAALYALPAPVRDLGYKLVARYRYAVFGRSETCRVPSGDFKSRFIEYDGPADDGAPPFAAAA